MVHLGLKTVSVTCYVFPIGGVDIILGVSFVSHSCRCMHELLILSIEFFIGGNLVSLFKMCPFYRAHTHVLSVGEVVCLHGVSRSIVSNRNLIFVLPFWLEFFKGVGSRQKISLTYH